MKKYTIILFFSIFFILSFKSNAQQREHYSGQLKNGIDFFLIGDYGYTRNLHILNKTLLTMDKVMSLGNNETNPTDLIDFIFTAGDNIYPEIPFWPEDKEFESIFHLFKKKHLKNLKLYAVRGNHDCKFDWETEIKLMNKHDNWYMPSLYYKQEIDMGGGKKFGILHVDTCLLLCSTYSFKTNSDSLHYNLLCSTKYTKWGNQQYKWIIQTLEEWEQDSSIIWKATVQHHMLFGKHYFDFNKLVDNYLPLLIRYKVDLYLNGHEHTMTYATFDYEKKVQNLPQENELVTFLKVGKNCHAATEFFYPNHENSVRSYQFNSGSAIHQVTSGLVGKKGYQLCYDQHTQGRFYYAQNKHNGFVQIHADEDKIVLKYRGVDNEQSEINWIELFDVTISKTPTTSV